MGGRVRVTKKKVLAGGCSRHTNKTDSRIAKKNPKQGEVCRTVHLLLRKVRENGPREVRNTMAKSLKQT